MCGEHASAMPPPSRCQRGDRTNEVAVSASLARYAIAPFAIAPSLLAPLVLAPRRARTYVCPWHLRKHLARIQDVVGIKGRLDTLHQRDRVRRQLEADVRLLREADA